MKKILLILSLLSISWSFSQLTTTNINFDNFISATDNDLKNNFTTTADYTIAQNFSGYYVKTPLLGTVTQPLIYCSKYQGIDSETMKISIDYQFEEFGPTFDSGSVGIYLISNINELVLSSAIIDRTLYMGGLINPSSPYSPTLLNGIHPNLSWYRLTFEISKIATNQYSLTSTIFNLGANGLSTPTQILTQTKQGYNYNFGTNKIVSIRLMGGKWGDVTHLDNFSIYGFKNGTNCSNLSTAEASHTKAQVFPNPTSKYVNFDSEASKVELYNINGALINIFDHPNGKIDIEHLDTGIYILKIYLKNEIITKKITKQ